MSRAGRVLLALAAAMTLGVPAAHGADDVGVSTDGVTWSDGLDAPLFDPAVRWVPGDSRVASLYVRNQGPTGASVTIEARSVDADALLADDDVQLRARAGGGGWVPLRNGVSSARLTEQTVVPGDVVRVEVDATFDPRATDATQLERLALDVRVVLRDGLGAGAAPPVDGEAVGGALPDTGTGVARRVLALAAALLVTGIVLTAVRRPRRGEAP